MGTDVARAVHSIADGRITVRIGTHTVARVLTRLARASGVNHDQFGVKRRYNLYTIECIEIILASLPHGSRSSIYVVELRGASDVPYITVSLSTLLRHLSRYHTDTRIAHSATSISIVGYIIEQLNMIKILSFRDNRPDDPRTGTIHMAVSFGGGTAPPPLPPHGPDNMAV